MRTISATELSQTPSLNDQISVIVDGLEWVSDPTIVLPVGNYKSTVQNGSVLVSVGDNIVAYSTNGTTWTKAVAPNNYYTKVIFANNLYVAIGLNACITSPDGINWTNRSIPVGVYTDLIYKDQFIAVGTNIISKSSDGVNWTSKSVPDGTYRSMVYANSLFVAVGDSGLISISTDGVTWEKVNSKVTVHLYHIVYINNRYVATGGSRVTYSTDGITWTAVNPGIGFVGMGSNGSRLVASINDNYIYYSDDYGVNWNAVRHLGDQCQHMTSNGGQTWVCSNYWSTYRSTDNGSNWTGVNTNTNGINKLVYANGMFVMVEDGGVRYSSNGATNTWTFKEVYAGRRWNDIAFINNRWVLSGSGFISISKTADIAGVWETIDCTGTFITAQYGNAQYVVLGSNTRLNSSDGITWVADTFNAKLKGIVYTGSRYVAISDTDAYISDTSDRWGKVTIPTGTYNAISINATNDVILIAGINKIIKSTNGGLSWTSLTPPSYTYNEIYAVNGKWIALTDQQVLKSDDNGSNWSELTSIGETLHSCWYDTNSTRYYFIGGNAIVYADSTLKWAQYVGPDMNVCDSAYYKQLYLAISNTSFKRSTDGLTWTTLANTPTGTYYKLKVIRGMLYLLCNNGLYYTKNLSTWTRVVLDTAVYIDVFIDIDLNFTIFTNNSMLKGSLKTTGVITTLISDQLDITKVSVYRNGYLALSKDQVHYIEGTQLSILYASPTSVQDLAVNKDIVVLVGLNITISQDTLVWNISPISNLDLSLVDYIPNYGFIALGNTGYVSSNGYDWRQTPIAPGPYATLLLNEYDSTMMGAQLLALGNSKYMSSNLVRYNASRLTTGTISARYVPEMVEDLPRYLNVNFEDRVPEPIKATLKTLNSISPGTGKITKPFLQVNFNDEHPVMGFNFSYLLGTHRATLGPLPRYLSETFMDAVPTPALFIGGTGYTSYVASTTSLSGLDTQIGNYKVDNGYGIDISRCDSIYGVSTPLIHYYKKEARHIVIDALPLSKAIPGSGEFDTPLSGRDFRYLEPKGMGYGATPISLASLSSVYKSMDSYNKFPEANIVTTNMVVQQGTTIDHLTQMRLKDEGISNVIMVAPGMIPAVIVGSDGARYRKLPIPTVIAGVESDIYVSTGSMIPGFLEDVLPLGKRWGRGTTLSSPIVKSFRKIDFTDTDVHAVKASGMIVRRDRQSVVLSNYITDGYKHNVKLSVTARTGIVGPSKVLDSFLNGVDNYRVPYGGVVTQPLHPMNIKNSRYLFDRFERHLYEGTSLVLPKATGGRVEVEFMTQQSSLIPVYGSIVVGTLGTTLVEPSHYLDDYFVPDVDSANIALTQAVTSGYSYSLDRVDDFRVVYGNGKVLDNYVTSVLVMDRYTAISPLKPLVAKTVISTTYGRMEIPPMMGYGPFKALITTTMDLSEISSAELMVGGSAGYIKELNDVGISPITNDLVLSRYELPKFQMLDSYIVGRVVMTNPISTAELALGSNTRYERMLDTIEVSTLVPADITRVKEDRVYASDVKLEHAGITVFGSPVMTEVYDPTIINYVKPSVFEVSISLLGVNTSVLSVSPTEFKYGTVYESGVVINNDLITASTAIDRPGMFSPALTYDDSVYYTGFRHYWS